MFNFPLVIHSSPVCRYILFSTLKYSIATFANKATFDRQRDPGFPSTLPSGHAELSGRDVVKPA